MDTIEAVAPLSWIRVVDLTDIRGALCARILGDLGADVIRVERSEMPRDMLETNAHRYRNANKRGTRIDLVRDPDRLDALLVEADVLVENLRAEDREDFDLSAEVLAERFPHLVHVAMPDMGLWGPRSRWHLEALPAVAAAGTLHASGFPHLAPCNGPGYIAHDGASVYGAVGAVAAVLDRLRHGSGQLVEVSVQEAGLASTVLWSVAFEDYKKLNSHMSVEGKRNGDGFYWVLPAADGWVRVLAGTDRQWNGFVQLLGAPEALTSPEWNERNYRLANQDVIRLVAYDCLVDRTREQLFEQARELSTAVGVVNTLREFIAHPQTTGRGFFTATGFPGVEDLPFASHPVNLSATPASIRLAAPTPGDDGEARFAARAAHPAAVLAPDNGLLLDGVRVVEFGAAAVIPEMCGVLSELGADVIKIESLAHPDLLRGPVTGPINCSAAFNAENRGRRSVAIDLSTAEGRDLAMELCARSDVVAENQRGGVLDRLGLGYDDVKVRNPGVIYASSQGYGRGGPYGENQAYGPLNTAFAGAQLLWNHPDAPYPCGTTLTYPDHVAGKLLAVSVLAALHHRAKTGEGQMLEMAQTEVIAYFLGHLYLDASLQGVDLPPLGNRHPDAAPHGVYPSAGDDEWIAIAVMCDGEWRALCAAIGWADESTEWGVAERLRAQNVIDERLTRWTVTRSAAEAAEVLQKQGVSAMPVMGPIDHHADPHLAERSFLVGLRHPEVGEERHVANPMRMSRLAQRTAQSAPCLGADTESVLESVLGLGAREIARLRERGVCR